MIRLGKVELHTDATTGTFEIDDGYQSCAACHAPGSYVQANDHREDG